MKDNLYTIGYAGVLGTVCALLLTGVASFTAPYKANNARVEEVLADQRELIATSVWKVGLERAFEFLPPTQIAIVECSGSLICIGGQGG